MTPPVETELRDGILVLRQNRPQVLNARDDAMYAGMIAALRKARDDDSVAAVLLTGRGRYFCSGMDFGNDPSLGRAADPADDPVLAAVKRETPPHDPDDPESWLGMRIVLEFIRFDKPIFGAANGPAVGEGFTSLLHCDALWAVEGAFFWAPFARAGAVPEFCSTILLPRRLGSLGTAAMYLGRKITVEEAHRAGFVTEILPGGDDFEGRVLERIRAGLALMGPPELRARTLRDFKRLAYGDATRAELERQCRLEFGLLRERNRAGISREIRRHYAAELPRRKG